MGRQDAVDRLWTDAAAALGGDPALTVLTGGPGVGKTRLASWVAHRLVERGAACLHLTHAPSEDALAALARLLAERSFWLPSPLPGPLEALRAGEAVAPAEAEPALAGLLARSPRPLVLVLDDLQWGPSSLRVARRLGRIPGARVWVLGTWRGHPEPAEVAPDRCVRVDPLSRADLVELVAGSLGAPDDAADLLARHADGNPLFATQILTAWWTEGRLGEPTFRAPESGAVPTALLDLLDARAAPLTRDPAWSAVALGAALGPHVDLHEWTDAAAHLGEPDAGRHLDRLARTGWIETTPRGWRFTHGLLRDAVLRAEPDVARLHRACAEALGARVDGRNPGLAGRFAEHLEGTGDREAARDAWARALTLGAELLPESPDTRRAAERLLALDPTPAQAAEARFRIASASLVHGRGVDDPSAIERLAEDAAAAGAVRVSLRARLLLQSDAHWRGRVDDALAMGPALEAAIREAGELDLLALLHTRLASILDSAGDPAGCLASAREAVRWAPEGPMRGRALSRLAEHHLGRGDLQEADALATRAAAEHARVPRRSVSSFANDLLLADLARRRGDGAGARARAERARAGMAEHGLDRSLMHALAGYLLALVDRSDGRLEEAEARFVVLEEAWTSEGHPYALCARVQRARVRAEAHGDWSVARSLLAAPPVFLPDADMADALEALVGAAPADLSGDLDAWRAPWTRWRAGMGAHGQ